MKNKSALVVTGLLLALILITPHRADATWGVRDGSPQDPIVAPPSNGLPAAGVTPRAHYVIRGGYVAAGVAMRNSGHGHITIAGVPAHSKVVRAFLYWDVLNPSPSASLAWGAFNGNPIQGDLVGMGADPCWEPGGNFAYRADVTKLVTGNGVYALTRFASGLRTGVYPWSASIVPPLAEGATLIVIYYNKASPAMDMVLVEGSDLVNGSAPYALTVSGFLASNPVTTATYTSFGADGQTVGSCAPGKQIFVNGTLLDLTDWDGADGPNELWDTHTHDISGLVKPGDTSTAISYPGNTCDCFVWVGAIVAVSAADTDGDGLLDAWEINGYTDPTNGKFVDLPGMGAKFDHKDLFVQIDYMVGAFNHKPKLAAIQKVKAAFRNAPVLNPDGVNGVNLHVDYGQGGLFNGGKAIAYQAILPGVISGDWSTFDTIKAANFATERAHIFHFCIFAHDINAAGTSGISRGIPERDFVVSLGEWTNHVGTVQEQAGTFMHELGHNINLRHGGVDNINYKPNFLSIMNYLFQTRGLRKTIAGVTQDGVFDYSRFLLPALDETALNERTGLHGGAPIAAYGTRYFCGATQKVVNNANGRIDWDCDGGRPFEISVAADINNDGSQTTLQSFQDWDNLDFRGVQAGTTPGHMRAPSFEEAQELSHELTVAEDRRITPSSPATAVQNADSIQWTPVGLEIISSYKIYQVGPHGGKALVKTVPSSVTTEELGQVSVSIPGGKGVRYGITSVDRYGNESDLVMTSSIGK